MSGVGVCQRAAVTTVRSRPLGIVDNTSVTRTRARALCSYHRPRHQEKACVSFQLHHTVIAASAAAARCEAAAVQVSGAGRARSGARLLGSGIR